MSLSQHLPEIHKIKRCIMGKWAGAARRASNAPLSVYDNKRESWNQPAAEKRREGRARNRVWGEIITSVSGSFALLSSRRAASSP